MATWASSKKFECENHNSSYPNGDKDYYEWTYQTSTDVLNIVKNNVYQTCAYGQGEYEPQITPSLYCVDEAHALYRCLRNWIRVYEGEKCLESLDKEGEEE